MKISEVSGDRVDNKTKLEIIQKEEEAIREEIEEKVMLEEQAEKQRQVCVTGTETGIFNCNDTLPREVVSAITPDSFRGQASAPCLNCKTPFPSPPLPSPPLPSPSLSTSKDHTTSMKKNMILG